MHIAIHPDIKTLSNQAAGYIVQVARQAIVARGLFSFGLSGGSTPGALYRLLASEPYRSQIAWQAVHFFWSDERCVAASDPESNFRLAQETLLHTLQLGPEQIHRMPADRPDRQQAAAEYAEEIRRVLGSDGTPAFDLLQLGMGPEAHTASLFPHQPALHERERLVLPVVVPKAPPERLTFTPPLLQAARHLLFLASGGEKAEALQAVVEGADQPDLYPAQLITRRAQGEVVWMVDSAIARQLTMNT
jgi:6-phosphogluconolactonase